MAIPTTLEASLMARIDRLSPVPYVAFRAVGVANSPTNC